MPFGSPAPFFGGGGGVHLKTPPRINSPAPKATAHRLDRRPPQLCSPAAFDVRDSDGRTRVKFEGGGSGGRTRQESPDWRGARVIDSTFFFFFFFTFDQRRERADWDERADARTCARVARRPSPWRPPGRRGVSRGSSGSRAGSVFGLIQLHLFLSLGAEPEFFTMLLLKSIAACYVMKPPTVASMINNNFSAMLILG